MADMKMLEPTDRGLSAGYMMWYRFSRNPAAVIGSLILLSVLVLAVFAPWLTPYPKHIGAVVDFRARHMPPDLEHWFGTDKAGRDIFSRTIFGLRVSLLLVIGVLGISVPVGTVLGLIAGYFGGWTEKLISGLTNVMLAMPPLVMALAVSNLLEPTLMNAMIAITLLWWTWHARLIYSVSKSIASEDYIEAARLAGGGPLHILFREILPNCVSVISVKTTLDAAFVILFGATLSFLGFGVKPPTPDLGSMVADGRQFMPDFWWEVLCPGAAVLYVTLGFNLLGDGLRDMFDVES
ncbi:ABC transporter permease [Rhizobium pusense]|uniref:ABC-type dipeptide/oligopeptide/nickel transport system, permease component n=2 Tax=Agrobacterium TaxID=357 RepID=A0A9W5F1R0_9HYPH|nr:MULTISPECIES: ABC transporter permease [Rhizobium/Agrobacterium group]MDH0909432.1 ABC transporter permease [Agrobacterium pusense]MDH1095239.1 ABC transporter permease [Agrobacterium pusense]MDH1112426.1 ABC transporter permease [Agrobacterium pusense]MDH2195675.1 ABC transporter permease [Agrobacterium pusense]OJH55387.1 D-ala-D-ala transporter subunit [Agrobacterium pusense]